MRGAIAAAALAASLAAIPSARAALGEGQLQIDAARLPGSAGETAPATGLQEESYLLPSGTRLKTWRLPDGRIAALRWQGPFMPDLQGLLGAHAGLLAQPRPNRQASRSALRVRNDEAVVESGGRLGAFHGMAWLPALLPPGIDPRQLP